MGMHILMLLIGLGAIAWLVSMAPFIDARFKRIANYVLVLIGVVGVLQQLGVAKHLPF